MDESMRPVIEAMVERVNAKQGELNQLKRAVNIVCRDAGTDPMYTDDDPQAGVSFKMRPDEYYGKPFQTAARDYMKRRGQAVSADDVLAGLEQGSFDFDALGWKPEGRLRTVAVSLAKNTAMFHKLPSGLFGLKEWYPDAIDRKKARRAESMEDIENTE